ncbi:MAG: hypothetical protein QW291_09220 [Thermofilaceae archaeon]
MHIFEVIVRKGDWMGSVMLWVHTRLSAYPSIKCSLGSRVLSKRV